MKKFLMMILIFQSAIGTPFAIADVECKTFDQNTGLTRMSQAEADHYLAMERENFERLSSADKSARIKCIRDILLQIDAELKAGIEKYQTTTARNNTNAGKIALSMAAAAVAGAFIYSRFKTVMAMQATARETGDESLNIRSGDKLFQGMIGLILLMTVAYGIVVTNAAPSVTREQAVDLRVQFNYMNRLLAADQEVYDAEELADQK